jgi:hypothetical protein
LSFSTRARLAALVAPLAVAILLTGVVATPALAREKKSVTIIRKVAAKHKLSKADTKALIVLARRESGYNTKCVTGSYRGLFQIKLTKYNRRKWRDPYFNTDMAIKQIKHQYKTPRRALAHSYSNGWY